MELKTSLSKIAKRFYENLKAIRVFNEQIGKLAEKYDKEVLEEFISTVSELLPLDVAEKTPSNQVETNNDYANTDANQEENGEENSNSSNEAPSMVDPAKLNELAKFLRNTRLNSPLQSQLLRQGALITLISFFESLIADLLQFFYLKYPNALPSEGHILSLADLREIGSIEDAEKYLIDKEVDDLLRENIETQIEYFTKRPKVNLKLLDDQLTTLVEINQRRNLLVHNSGEVNRTYIARVSKDYLREKEIKEGDILTVNGEYLSNSIDLTYLCGTILLEQCWRKWVKEEIEIADNLLRKLSYDLLVEKRWNLVIQIAEFASKLDFKSDSDSRIVTINHAIALKEQNKTDEMETLLSQKDWSSCSINFHVALYALRDQEKEMINFLMKSVAAEEIDKEALVEWPLFRWFRESNAFDETLEKLFPK